MVGFQTNLLFKEQKRIFSLIPALKNVEFLRYGTMHRNTYINAPTCLNKDFSLKNYKNIFFAGQISGVEGYVESIMSGLVCGINMSRVLNCLETVDFSNTNMIGGITSYFQTARAENFQPISANMGLLSHLAIKTKNKQEKYAKLSKDSLENLKNIIDFYKIMI